MTKPKLFEPMCIDLEREDDGKIFLTFSGLKRATRVAITAEEYGWLVPLFEANPGNEHNVFFTFTNVREGKATLRSNPDGTIEAVPLTEAT